MAQRLILMQMQVLPVILNRKEMRKIILITAIISLGSVSCKKTYTCECTTSSNYAGAIENNKSGATKYDSKMTKKQAQSACDHEAQSIKSTFENSFSENRTAATSATVVTSCELN